MEQAQISDALDQIKVLVQADGGDMELVDIDQGSGTVSLRLVLDGVDCHECVMQRSMLEDISADMMRKTVPDLVKVAIDDPREHPDYVAPDTH